MTIRYAKSHSNAARKIYDKALHVVFMDKKIIIARR